MLITTLVVSLFKDGVGSLTVKFCLFTERNDQRGNHHHSRELLMMGIVVPETCWSYKKYNKISSGIYLVPILQLSQRCTVQQTSNLEFHLLSAPGVSNCLCQLFVMFWHSFLSVAFSQLLLSRYRLAPATGAAYFTTFTLCGKIFIFVFCFSFWLISGNKNIDLSTVQGHLAFRLTFVGQ